MKPRAKNKRFLKELLTLAAVIAAIIYINSQTPEHRDFLTLIAIIIYVAWLAQQRLDKLSKEKFYPCLFEKDIIAVDSDDVLVTLQIEHSLPFVPFLGLSVISDKNPATDNIIDYDKHDNTSFYTGNIISVCWSYSRFVCKVEPFKMTESKSLGGVIATSCKYAWEIGLMFPDIREALETYINERENKLAAAKPDDEMAVRERDELESLKKKIKQ